MFFEEERRAIENRFSTAWGSTTPVKYENVEFIQPPNTKWVALTIINADAAPLTLSGGTEKHVGWIFIQIFDILDRGQVAARQLAAQAAAIFKDSKFSAGTSAYIVCRTPSLVTIGSREGLFQMNVKVPFQRFTNG